MSETIETGEHKGDHLGRDRLINNVLSGWGAHLVTIIVGFVLPRLIDENVGQRMLGIWDLGWSTVTYLGLSNIGIAAALTHFVARYAASGESDKSVSVISSVFLWQAGIALVIFAGVFFLPGLVSQHIAGVTESEAKTFYWVLILLGAAISVSLIDGVYRGMLTGMHRWDINNAVSIGTDLSIAFFMIVSLIAGGGLITLAAVNLGCVLIALLVRIGVCRHSFPHLQVDFRTARWAGAKSLLAYGLKSTLAFMPNLLVMQSSRLLVAATAGPAALAIFARPLTLTLQGERAIDRFSVILTSMAGSAMGSGKKKELKKILVGASRIVLMMGIPILVILAIYEDLILETWMGSHYRSDGLLPILALGTLLPMWQGPSARVLAGMNAHGKPSLITLCSAVSIFFALATYFNFEITPFRGAVLVAASLSLSGALVSTIFATKALQLRYLEFCWQTLGKVLLCVFLPCLGLYWLSSQPLTGVALVDAGLSCAAFGIVLFILYLALLFDEKVISVYGGKVHTRSQMIYGVMRIFGLLHLALYFHRNRLTVFTVHSVMSDSHANSTWQPVRTVVSPEALEKQLGWLKKYYNFLTPEKAFQFISGNLQVSNPALMTIDDGYANASSIALEVLARNDVPSLVFLPTKPIRDQKRFWFDRLDYVLQQLPADLDKIQHKGEEIKLLLTNRKRIRATCIRLIRDSRSIFPSDKERHAWFEELIIELERLAGKSLADIDPDPWTTLLTYDGARQAQSRGQFFGSHSVDHVRLGGGAIDMVRTQLIDAKSELETELGTTIDFFCYPEGSYDEQTLALARESGYLASFTSEPGTNRQNGDPHKLARYHLSNDLTRSQLIAMSTGISDLFALKRRLNFKTASADDGY